MSTPTTTTHPPSKRRRLSDHHMSTPTTTTTTTHPPSKRRRLSDHHHHHQSLLPGLPDHIANICLSLISPTIMYSVCRSWRHHIYTTSFPPFPSLYTLSLPTTTATATANTGQMLRLSSFDPISSKWITIESPPLPPFLHRHPSFISRSFPIQSVAVSGNLLLLAATSVHRNMPIPAFPHPLIFNPLTNTWSSGPPLATPRRWCAAGACKHTVVVASGVGDHYTETVARSIEKWVVRKTKSFDQKPQESNETVKKIQSLSIIAPKTESFDQSRRDSNENLKKIQRLSFLAPNLESFDPKRQDSNTKKLQSLSILAPKTESFDQKGRDSNGNSKKIQSLSNLTTKDEYCDEKRRDSNENMKKIQTLSNFAPKTEFFDEKRRDSNVNWEKMQSLKNSKLCREAIDAIGWKGKLLMVNVKGDYTKEGFVYNLDSDEWAAMPVGMLGGWRGPAAAMEEETVYVVDESRGVLRRYNEDGDKWSEVVVDERLRGAEYVAAGGGRVCVVGGGVGVVVVDVVVAPPRVWVVETSPEWEIVGVHILPRVGLPEMVSPVRV